jgi:FlaG/FlaF family flagellin (archaellin)
VPYIGQQPAPKVVTSSDLADDVVTADKIGDTAISGFSALGAEPADTDELLISDAGTLKRMDYSYIKGGGGLVLLSSTNVTSSASAVEFTSGIDSTYSVYKILISNCHGSTDNQDMELLISQDGGSSYKSSDYTFVFDSQDGDSNTGDENSTSASRILLTGDNVGSVGNESFSGEIILYNPSSTVFYKHIEYRTVYFEKNALVCECRGVASYKGNTSAINGIKLKFASGTIDLGRFSLYGIAHS